VSWAVGAYVSMCVEVWVVIAALIFREGYRRLPDTDWDGVLWTYRTPRQQWRRDVIELGLAFCGFVVIFAVVMSLGSWVTGNGVF
jgi:hypothetical protein